MATIDEILGGGTSRQETPPKGTREWAENNSGENAPLNITHAKNESKNDNAEMTYTDLYRKLNPYKPPTPEELEKEKKKQKRDQVIAAIGDGISALSNLFFTTKGAPSMYDGRNNMSEKTKVRYDKLMKEREGKDAAWYAGYMRAMGADKEKADRERAWQRQLGLDEEARQRHKDKAAKEDIAAKQSAELHDLLVKLKGHEIGYAEAKRKEKEIKAKYADQLAKAEVEKERAQAKYYGNGGGSGNGGKYTLFNKQTGVTEEFKTRSEWLRRAGELGYDTKPGESNSASHDDFRGNKTTTTEKGATLEERIGRQEAEARARWEEENGSKKKKSPTAGDSSSKKKSPTM